MSYGTKRKDRTELGHTDDLGREKAPASRDLAGLWLVLRGHATDSVGDPRPPQQDAVIRTGIVDALGEAEFS